MCFQIGIVTHTQREQMADALAELTHPVLVSVDEGKLGATSNHLTVWGELVKLDATWSVVLEDDAAPVPDFREHLYHALRAAPTPVVSLYLGKIRPPQWQQRIADATAKADANECHWIVGTEMLHAVGIAIKTDLVLDMLANNRPYLPFDQSIGRWSRKRNHRVSYVWPSLVDHRDVPTLIEHPDKAEREPGRVAWKTGIHLDYNQRFVEL